MPARFTNLRPAEAKPVDRLRALHTPLYAEGDTSAFRDSIIDAGLPSGIALAAARIASPDFADRAEYAVGGDLKSATAPLGNPSFVALARLLVRTKRDSLADEVRRGELSPALAAHISATFGIQPAGPALGDTGSTALGKSASTLTVALDDLLSLYLVPGAFADYRRLLGKLLPLHRLVTDSGKNLGALLLPSPTALVDDLHGPWPGNKPPLAWDILLLGRILLPAGVAYRAPPAADQAAGGGGRLPMSGALAASGLSAADIRRIESIVSGPAAAAGAGSATAANQSAQSKVAGTDHRD